MNPAASYPTASPEKPRLLWLDIAKGIGIILVVVGHLPQRGAAAMAGLHDAIFLFHMPLFFLLSGLTFRPSGAGQAWRARARGLLLPYLSFAATVALLDLGLALALDQTPFVDLTRPATTAARFVIGGGAFYTPFSAFWFLTCLFGVAVIYDRVARSNPDPLGSALLSLAALAALVALGAGQLADMPAPFGTVFDLNPLGWLSLPAGLAFFWAGHALAQSQLGRLQHSVWLAASLVAMFLALPLAGTMNLKQAYIGNLANLPVAFGLSLAVLAVARGAAGFGPLARPLAKLGRASLTIMALHMLVIRFAEPYVGLALIGLSAIALPLVADALARQYRLTRAAFLGGRG